MKGWAGSGLSDVVSANEAGTYTRKSAGEGGRLARGRGGAVHWLTPESGSRQRAGSGRHTCTVLKPGASAAELVPLVPC